MRNILRWGALPALLLALCLFLLPTKAEAATVDDLTYTVSNGEVTIGRCNENVTGDVVIPATIDGYPVTAIADSAFSYRYYVTSVTIPDSVKRIGTSVFYCCDNLTGIWVGQGNMHYSNDENGVLFNKDKTILVTCPQRISGTYTVPNSVATIGEHAFRDCDALTDVIISKNVTTIGRYAFSSCTSLTEVEIGSGVVAIGDSAFSHCVSLIKITIPDSVTCIGDELFSECSSLTHVTIGSGVTTISFHMFFWCTSLTCVTIPDSVTAISDGAFCTCSSLTDVIIPDSVTTIGENAFYPCAQLSNVHYGGTETQWEEISIGRYNEHLTNATIHYTEPAVTGISIQTAPDKVIYGISESLDTAGLTLMATYDDDSTKTVTEGFTVTGFDAATPGTQTLTVTYEGYTATYTVTVKDNETQITTQPGAAEIVAGNTAEFKVEAVNAAAYCWQYRRNSTAPWVNTTLTGYATDTLSVTAILSRNGYQYRCRVTGNDSKIYYTEPATLTVLDSVVITTQPSRQIVNVGANATFAVEAEGAGLTYQWLYRKNDQDFWKQTGMEGNKTNTLTVPALQTRNGYQYRCAITDENGVAIYSNAATLSAISFTAQPQDQTVAVNANAVFSVAAKGQDLTYQWQYRKTADGAWMNTTLTGCKTDTLTVLAIASRNGYQYRCRITDALGIIRYSDPATLTVE